MMFMSSQLELFMKMRISPHEMSMTKFRLKMLRKKKRGGGESSHYGESHPCFGGSTLDFKKIIVIVINV